MTDWQPIKTAPKTGIVMLLHDPAISEGSFMGRWDDARNLWSFLVWPMPTTWTANPTHWMPLPEGPK